MLKRAFIALTVIVGMAMAASAQNIEEVDDVAPVPVDNEILPPPVYKPYVLSIGPKVGANYSLASDPDDMELGIGGSIGYSAGLAVNLRFARPEGRPIGSERFGVQVEALYAQRTLSNDYDDIKLSCFEVPVLFQWYVIPTFAIEVGPTFTGAFSSSPDRLVGHSEDQYYYYTSVMRTDKIKAYDVMLTVGATYKHRSGFTASLRYNMGNSDIAGNFETKVSTVSLGIGWLFSVIK